MLTKKSSLVSALRRIPREMWENVFDYMRNKPKYILADLGSKNGTWIYEIGSQEQILE